MVEEEHTDPLEITKDPIILKAAQVELSKLDILVCGECHEVFHFIEELQEHRLQNKCSKESVLKECIQTESKSQVWGFMLWKNAKFKNVPNDTTHPTSWTVYQLWCNLEQTQKNAWIIAGKSLQNIYTISTANLQPPLKAVPAKPVKTVLSTPYRKDDDDEPENLEEGEIRTKKKLKPTSNDSSKLDSEQDPLADTESDIDIEEEIDKERAKQNKCENGGIKKTILKPVQLNSDVTILPSTKKGTSKRAIRSNNDDKKIEYVVEKIISKRYNPGKKTHEYLVKWEDFDEEQNTWEPIAHLDSCKQLTEEFDRNLQKLKAQKLAKSPLVQRRVYRKSLPENNANLILSTAVGRPQRTSKQKALNQVKVWCGNMSDADEGSNKRSYSDSDSDSFEKKMKLEAESSDSEDDRPVVTVKRVMKSALNGIGRRQPLPENILVPDAQGIVRINQKQLPALSSGVYVMSKTAGIIKLDSNTSKIAASGGHAVIKVAPKIGQTSIKVVKREASNGSKPNIITRVKQPMKAIAAKVIAHRKGPAPAILRKAEPIKIEVKQEDEESDGLEELPFPTDLPLPEPDSPPGDFTLCPLTGRILGQDEKHPRNDEISQDVNTSSDNTATLDNLVNLAAADILNESPVDEKVEAEVKNDEKDKSVSDLTEPIAESVAEESKLCKNDKPDKTQTIEEALSAMEADDIPVAATSSASSTSSILSTALSNANIEPTANVNAQKKVVTTTESIRQKTAMNRSIINRTIVPKPAPQAIITRITPGTINRHKQLINKSKMGAPPPTFRKTIRQTYSNKHSIIRKIGSTSVYQSSPTTSQPSQQSVSTTESLVQTLSATSPPGVINMPLLTDVESPSTSTNIQDIKAEPDPEPEPAPPTENTDTDINAISLNDSETPLLITGEDGTIYQVAGQNEDGQTILIAQDADGQQQCLLVASESGSDLAEPEVVNTPVEAEIPDQMEEEPPVNTEPESDNAEDSQIVAQIVSAQPPSPGGTRKVVLMLPDGNLMMTEVTAEQYAALELDK